MFSKILVANRGEIALRVIRACREAGIKSVAVYSEADAESLHLKLADEAVCIGPGPSAKSYLSIDNIINAAKETGADGIHPGYGYLAEKEDFAIACAGNNIVFIGPTPQNLSMAGDKIAGKKAMQEVGVPTIPSSPGSIDSIDEAKAFCLEIGYPVMIKASAGGGGRGIRICQDEAELSEEFPVAKMEAQVAFANNEVFIERFITQPRHIEFQILADKFGKVIHLGERECTIQRRYQKLIEESPSPALTPELRKTMGDAAIKAAKAINYLNAGTVEFLLDPKGNFYFIEINSRIQVEHPVTELTTGIDLVREQIRLAAGERLDYDFESLNINTWAIECRINAEDPARGFMPSPGTIEAYRPPGGPGVRLDTHLYQGYELPIYYDSMVAKLITYSSDREGAIRIMKRALTEFEMTPLKTTMPLYLQVMDDPDFQAGEFDTSYINRFVPDDYDDDDDDDD
ncbi:MAG: acetyl-CoA carboxylase biotin carboxylase subunit [Deltaproteobacteria bacterium]|jgi:acetyl-CoA carboxylase, biotin carboxylase subunit|nr:acetyl-CoA carboxylase biotin carboxylase subunit [Deltaproteobacteria bacterium]MBT4642172.1 acetyl-CoA carboxylase biotin carboxylase subunit [Deltaproteobacteria bacterium]MBT6500584.1 acetyl-CoA carboxylase biotin carboxylase subunit [Deltaproteobacteria bacterium]MBT7152165.1 acetyl-CoA carboxylase biotin carboxylase subunit [Deltaproteobacteria bacterium]MBT7889560.1 acetyl-CoA carboxylase biotin carboxylase subunit [Deltaproteobacteria bacterium]